MSARNIFYSPRISSPVVRGFRPRRRRMAANAISNRQFNIPPVISYPFPAPRTNINRIRRGRSQFLNATAQTRTVRAPAAVGMVVESANNSPFTNFSGTNYVFDIPSSTSFSSYSWFMHPINIPFLKEQAELFSRYQFLSLKYRVVTTAPTNMSGQHWSGYQMRTHETKPSNMGEAQYLQAFHLAPIWKSDVHFTNIDPVVLRDRWYSTAQFASAIDPQLTPGYIYFGTSSMAADQSKINVGMLEVAYTIQFRDRRLPKGTQMNQHNQEAITVIQNISSLHQGSSAHNQAVQIRLKALRAEEINEENSEIHRSAVLEIIRDIKRHCDAQPTAHADLVNTLIDQFEELHPIDEDAVLVEAEAST